MTAVASEREGLVPSRFLDEIEPLVPSADASDVPERELTTPRRAMSLAPLVGELRRIVTTPGHPDAAVAGRASRPAGRGRCRVGRPVLVVGPGTAVRRAVRP